MSRLATAGARLNIGRMAAGFFVVVVVIMAISAHYDPSFRMMIERVNVGNVTDENVAWQIKPFLVRSYTHDAKPQVKAHLDANQYPASVAGRNTAKNSELLKSIVQLGKRGGAVRRLPPLKWRSQGRMPRCGLSVPKT